MGLFSKMDSDSFSSTLDLPNYFSREYAALSEVESPTVTLHLPIDGEQISNTKGEQLSLAAHCTTNQHKKFLMHSCIHCQHS